jgi:hypothetical protein
MFFHWYEAGRRGETPHTPAEGFKWSQLPALNQQIYEQYKNWPLEKVFEAFRASHRRAVELIQSSPRSRLDHAGPVSVDESEYADCVHHCQHRQPLPLGVHRHAQSSPVAAEVIKSSSTAAPLCRPGSLVHLRSRRSTRGYGLALRR